jgi:hypothetical protein
MERLLRLVRGRGRAIAAIVLVIVCYFVVGLVDYWPPESTRWPKKGWLVEKPEATSGDEPHYVVIFNSILFDHDVRVDPDYVRIKAGGYEAGAFWKGHDFGGHSILVDPRTGKHALCMNPCEQKEADLVGAPLDQLVQYPAHPIGYPAVMALIAMPFQPARENAECAMGIIMILIAAAGVVFTYAVARKSGMGPKPAIAAAALLGVASSWLPYVKSYFAETSIGLLLVLGLFALRSGRALVAGLLVGVAMIMKQPSALFAAVWIVERWFAGRRRDAVWLTVGMVVCGLSLVTFNITFLKSFTTTGNLPFAWANGLSSLYDTLLHKTQGVLLYVPWVVLALLWGVIGSRPGAPEREGLVSVEARRQMIIPILLTIATVASVAWGPGFCYGPRYWVPLFPMMAILAVDFALAGGPWRRIVLGVAAAYAMAIAVPASFQYHRLFSTPPLTAYRAQQPVPWP